MELEGPSTLTGSNKDVKISNVNVEVELLNTPLFKSLFWRFCVQIYFDFDKEMSGGFLFLRSQYSDRCKMLKLKIRQCDSLKILIM